jgi:hypothetical protein
MTQESHLPDLDRITRTVTAGLAWSLKSDRPFQQATDLILLLKSTPGWTDAEIFEVQGRLLDSLHDHAQANPSDARATPHS